MKKRIFGLLAALSVSVAVPAIANDSVMAGQSDAKQWVMQLGNYAGTRYSELDQINKDNVGDLQVAWTFSTGVLRGHEGSPLVIGDVMYLHTPFPNIVYALDLNNDGKILWRYTPQQDPEVIRAYLGDLAAEGVTADDLDTHHRPGHTEGTTS